MLLLGRRYRGGAAEPGASGFLKTAFGGAEKSGWRYQLRPKRGCTTDALPEI